MKEPITTGLASFGMSGQVFHAPLLVADSRFNLKYILERSKHISREKYPETTIIRSFNEMIEREDMELVVVNTPDKHHYELTRKALLANKHVVVEKPFTLTAEEANSLIALAQKQQKLLSVFQNRRWDSDFRTVQTVLEQHLLGRLVDYEAHFDRFRNYIQQNTWKEDPGAESGLIYNLGSHLIDQALVLFGKPEAVTGNLRIVRKGGRVNDYFDLTLHYPELDARLKSSYLVRQPGPRFILHGNDGSFVKYGTDPQEEALKLGANPNQPNWGKEPEANWGYINTQSGDLRLQGQIESLPGNYSRFYENIFEAIRNKAELLVKPEQAMEGIRIIEAAMESSKQGTTISLQQT